MNHNPAQEHDTHGFSAVLVDDQDLSVQFAAAAGNLPAVQSGTAGLVTKVEDGIITAQRVAVRRDMAAVLANIKIHAGLMGDAYYYHWQTNNKDNTKSEVSGPSIKCANDVARLYGNCQVDVRVTDQKEHWIIYARFVDYETGYSLTRAFQQRKNQSAGKRMEADRQTDIAFQIGQSKAVRNVVCNALGTLTDYAVEESKRGLVEKIGRNMNKALEQAKSYLDELGVAIERVVRVQGRSPEEWTARDIAKIATSIRAVQDGMAIAEDIWPSHATTPPPANTPPPAKGGPKPREKPDAESKPVAAENGKPTPQGPKAKGPPAAPADPAPTETSTEDPDVDPARFADPDYAEGIITELRSVTTLDDLNEVWVRYEDTAQEWPEEVYTRVADAYSAHAEKIGGGK